MKHRYIADWESSYYFDLFSWEPEYREVSWISFGVTL